MGFQFHFLLVKGPLSLSIFIHHFHFLCAGTRSAWCWCWPSPPSCSCPLLLLLLPSPPFSLIQLPRCPLPLLPPSPPPFSFTHLHSTLGLPLCLKDLGLVNTKSKTHFTCSQLNSSQSKYSTVHHFQFLVSVFLRHLIVDDLLASHPMAAYLMANFLRRCHVSIYFFLAGHFKAVYLIDHPLIEQFLLIDYLISQKVVAGELEITAAGIFKVLELFLLSALLSVAKIVHLRISNLLRLIMSSNHFIKSSLFLAWRHFPSWW